MGLLAGFAVQPRPSSLQVLGVVDVEVTFLADGRPCLVLMASDALRELAEFIDRSDRSEVYSGRMPCPSATPFVMAARQVLAISRLVPLPEPEHASGAQQRARWITTTEAAELLNISDRAVRKRIQAGNLCGRQLGGRWLVDIKEIPDAAA